MLEWLHYLPKRRTTFNDDSIGLKTTFSREFVYGELAGMSLPDENGVQSVWDDAYVANLYDIDELSLIHI